MLYYNSEWFWILCLLSVGITAENHNNVMEQEVVYVISVHI